jgi:hypothetical protein
VGDLRRAFASSLDAALLQRGKPALRCRFVGAARIDNRHSSRSRMRGRMSNSLFERLR